MNLTSAGQTFITDVLRKADSLLHIENTEEADSLLRQIEKTTQISRADQLKLQYLRGYYYNALEENTLAAKALLKLPEMAEEEKLFMLSAESNIQLALVHEKTGDFASSMAHLKRTYSLINKYHLDTLRGWYYVRISSYYRMKGQNDSALYFANKALPYAEKFQHLHGLADVNLLLGLLLREEPERSATYLKLALKYYEQQHNYHGVSAMYNNLSSIYLKMRNTDLALRFNDSAIQVANAVSLPDIHYNYLSRSKIYEQTKQYDSALIYFKQFSAGMRSTYEKNEAREIKKLAQQFEGEKKDSLIRLNKLRLFITIFIAALITIAFFLIYIRNRKIKSQNKKINAQVIEVNKLLKNKQILLSELQHRVKNNLQHLLSLLDIQEESLAHNNINEVIRETKNRVHSMALLHDKISYTHKYEEVNFEEYLRGMTTLIKDAYLDPKKQINIEINSEIKQLDIDNAIPLGLIIVELLSNSFKHAFNDKQKGMIIINTSKDPDSGKRVVYYGDDGKEFDFENPPKKGLGLELINGLIAEINATLYTKHTHGNAFTIRF